MLTDLSVLEQCVVELSSRRATVVVGIDGKSGVGKSTASEWLARRIDAVVIDGDSFFAGGTSVRAEPPLVLAEMCIDRPKLAAVLEGLRRGGSVSYRPFDWEAFDGSLLSPEIRVSPSSVYILDGVYSCHPDLGELVDLRVVGYVSDQTRMDRLLTREGEIGAWEKQWHDAEDWYFKNLMPHDCYDLRINLE